MNILNLSVFLDTLFNYTQNINRSPTIFLKDSPPVLMLSVQKAYSIDKYSKIGEI